MDFTSFDDGFFCIDDVHGFLPKGDPLECLPEQFSELQTILDNIPQYIKELELMEREVANLPNYIDKVKNIEDVFLLQALFRGYSMLASAYLLQPAHLNQVNGIYGKAKQVLPANITQPFENVAEKLNVFPFLDYHYAYSSGNYVKKDKTLSDSEVYKHDNLRLAVSFSGTDDERGFIMLHVDIVSNTKKIIRGIKTFLSGNKLAGLEIVLEASKEINDRRREMWKASDHRNYNNFRAFIMGIKGNTQIFDDGVIYEGSTNTEKRTYRGQTGAQDDTIPTLDIFTGVTKYYPSNELTKYLIDLRHYRPIVFQKFFKELELHTIDFKSLSDECKKVLYLILVEIYNFRNGHWQFVQKYIMENTKYATATGGTGINDWLPNQIGAVLCYMSDVIKDISDEEFHREQNYKLDQRIAILERQQQELRKSDYDATTIHDIGDEFNELKCERSTTKKKVCPFNHI